MTGAQHISYLGGNTIHFAQENCPSIENSKGNPQILQYGKVIKFSFWKHLEQTPFFPSVNSEHEAHLYGKI